MPASDPIRSLDAVAGTGQRDPHDWQVLARALLLNCSIWAEAPGFFSTGRLSAADSAEGPFGLDVQLTGQTCNAMFGYLSIVRALHHLFHGCKRGIFR